MSDPSLHLRRIGASAPSRREASPYPGAVRAVALCAVLSHLLARALVEPQAGTAVMVTFLSGSALAVAGLARGYPHPEFGAANSVTLLRLSLVSVLVGALVSGGLGAWSVPAVALATLALDGIDGWIARRTGFVSRYGARFDMEVDCGLALVLALLAFEGGEVGAWVLALGAARYVFWGASTMLPWLSGPLPDRRSRKVVCVVQIVALIAAVSPIGAPVAVLLPAGALAFVGWSFAADIRHLYRARP